MNIRFVTRNVHAFLDYPVAAALMGLPFVLGLGHAYESTRTLHEVGAPLD